MPSESPNNVTPIPSWEHSGIHVLSEIKALRRDMRDYGGKLDRLVEKLNEVDKHISTVAAAAELLTRLEDRVNALEDRVSELRGHREAIDEGMAEHKRKTQRQSVGIGAGAGAAIATLIELASHLLK